MNTLVIVSYGRENEYRRAILTVLSFWSLSDNATFNSQVVIYTDNPDYFSPYLTGIAVEYSLLTAERIAVMKGKDNFIHRLKIAVVEDALDKYVGSNLLYTDSDTFFIADPALLLARIQPGVSFMHKVEETLKERTRFSKDARDVIKLIDEKSFTTSQGEEKFDDSYYSWNAGVLAFSKEAASYIPDVYLLTDEFYTASKWVLSEQIAFSLILQKRTELNASDMYIYHYWEGRKKVIVDELLAKLFNKDFINLTVAEKKKLMHSYVVNLPGQIDQLIEAFFKANKEMIFREDAIDFFIKKDFKNFFRNAFAYLYMKPTDTKFIKDIFYYTKQVYLK